MFGRSEVSDKDLLRTLTARIARTGTSQSRINLAVQRGIVTLTGNLQFAAQRIPLMKAARMVAGVRQVIDQMQDVAKKKVH